MELLIVVYLVIGVALMSAVIIDSLTKGESAIVSVDEWLYWIIAVIAWPFVLILAIRYILYGPMEK